VKGLERNIELGAQNELNSWNMKREREIRLHKGATLVAKFTEVSSLLHEHGRMGKNSVP
jgi:hypothetical protein